MYKTSFQTHDHQFEFKVMPFGPSNAPTFSQKCLCFFDDILKLCKSWEEHMMHLETVFNGL